VLSANIDQTNTISVTCTNTTPYNIGLDKGLNGSSVTTRQMKTGSAVINYSLFSDSGRTTNWGNTVGTDTVAATGNGFFLGYLNTRLLGLTFLVIMPGLFAPRSGCAASLQVAPVFLDIAAPAAAATVTLRNTGATPIATQIRVFRWVQEEGRERLEPTADVVASPPQPNCGRGRTMSFASFVWQRTPLRAKKHIAS
jgi:Spore Coat Protein U domain